MHSPLIEAATLLTPGYEQMGMLAVQHFMRFAKCAGLPIRVNIIAQSGAGFDSKLAIDHIKAPNILWFDADWWLLRAVDFYEFLDGTFIGVQDPGVNVPTEFPCEDCERHGIPKERYINGGFFICPAAHRHALSAARALMETKCCLDFGEQSYLNLALHQLRVPVTTLPFRYNFWNMAVVRGAFPFIPRSIIGLHAAGIPPEEKLDHLLAQRDVFSAPTLPLIQSEWEALQSATYARKGDL